MKSNVLRFDYWFSFEDTQYKIEDCRPGESDLPF